MFSLSLGTDSVYTTRTWRKDVDHALKAKAGQYITLDAQDVSQTATIYAGETADSQYLNVLTEEDEASRPASSGWTGPGFSDNLDVPENISYNRNSLQTLISALDQELQPPLSAASEATLFEDFEPNAESTPHEPKIKHLSHSSNVSLHVPSQSAKSSRRSSIVYIKSDENPSLSPFSDASTNSSASPVVRPLSLKPKGIKSRSKKSADQENTPPKGLRALSLLQDCDHNYGPAPTTKPLNLGKVSKQKKDKANRENVQCEPGLKHTLKPLILSRSETTKQRAALREQEVLPDVIIRPPSMDTFSFNFR